MTGGTDTEREEKEVTEREIKMLVHIPKHPLSTWKNTAVCKKMELIQLFLRVTVFFLQTVSGREKDGSPNYLTGCTLHKSTLLEAH